MCQLIITAGRGILTTLYFEDLFYDGLPPFFQKFTLQSSLMSLLFENYWLAGVTCLLIRLNRTKFFRWNEENIERHGVNKQKHTPPLTPPLTQRKIRLEGAVKISDRVPLFWNNPLFYQELLFYGKIWTHLFEKTSKTQTLIMPTKCSFLSGVWWKSSWGVFERQTHYFSSAFTVQVSYVQRKLIALSIT